MLREIITKVYTFDELSDVAKEKARGWYIGVMETDLTMAVESLTEMLSALGWTVKDIHYSIAHSQSDYAAVLGSWEKADKKDTSDWSENATFVALAKQMRDIEDETEITQLKWWKGERWGRKERIEHAIKVSAVDGEETFILKVLRNINRVIYEYLRDDLEYQRSDEQVDETILVNEYEFTIDGKRA